MARWPDRRASGSPLPSRLPRAPQWDFQPEAEAAALRSNEPPPVGCQCPSWLGTLFWILVRRFIPYWFVFCKDGEEVEEETAFSIERAASAAADTAKKSLDEESTLRWEKVAQKVAEGQPQPSRTEKPSKEKRLKARHEPASLARMENPDSEPARSTPRGTGQPSPPSRHPPR